MTGRIDDRPRCPDCRQVAALVPDAPLPDYYQCDCGMWRLVHNYLARLIYRNTEALYACEREHPTAEWLVSRLKADGRAYQPQPYPRLKLADAVALGATLHLLDLHFLETVSVTDLPLLRYAPDGTPFLRGAATCVHCGGAIARDEPRQWLPDGGVAHYRLACPG